MKLTLNQIENDLNNSISEIPEDKLKGLLSQLYYQAYHSVFIDEDLEDEENALKAIGKLCDNNDPWKVFRATYDTIIQAPLKILKVLHHRKNTEIKDIEIRWFFTWFIQLSDDLNFNDSMIGCIDNCRSGNERKCLDSIRKSLIEVRDKQKALLKEDHNRSIPHEIIKHLESKTELSGPETMVLGRIKEVV